MRVKLLAVLSACMLAAAFCGGCERVPEMFIGPMGADEIPAHLAGYDCFSYTTDGTVSAMTVRLWLFDGEAWEQAVSTRDLTDAPAGIIALKCGDGGEVELVIANEIMHRSVMPDGAPDFSGMASVSRMTAAGSAILPDGEILLLVSLGYEDAPDEDGKTVNFKEFRESDCDVGLALEVIFES